MNPTTHRPTTATVNAAMTTMFNMVIELADFTLCMAMMLPAVVEWDIATIASVF
jgi:hypothetical protein